MLTCGFELTSRLYSVRIWISKWLPFPTCIASGKCLRKWQQSDCYLPSYFCVCFQTKGVRVHLLHSSLFSIDIKKDTMVQSMIFYHSLRSHYPNTLAFFIKRRASPFWRFIGLNHLVGLSEYSSKVKTDINLSCWDSFGSKGIVWSWSRALARRRHHDCRREMATSLCVAFLKFAFTGSNISYMQCLQSFLILKDRVNVPLSPFVFVATSRLIDTTYFPHRKFNTCFWDWHV